MKITVTVTFSYTISDSEIERFKEKVLEYIEGNLYDEFDEGDEAITLADLSSDVVEKFLGDTLPDMLANSMDDNNGVERDEYFNSISLDYCNESVCDLVQQMAEQICNNKKGI